MLNRTAILFPLILAGLMALLTFWIYQTVEQQGPKIDGSNRHDPDYIMENFVTTQTDALGKLSYVLTAAKMVHFPDDDSTVLTQPTFTQYAENKPYTKIKGLRANVSSNGEEIEVIDDVVVVRQAFAGKGEMQVLTDQLTLYPSKDIAKTDRPVVIKQAPKTVIHATGMIYDKKKKTLQLFKRVNAHYEHPKRKTK
jgi:lipopolysaccharide export system protein LptC